MEFKRIIKTERKDMRLNKISGFSLIEMLMAKRKPRLPRSLARAKRMELTDGDVAKAESRSGRISDSTGAKPASKAAFSLIEMLMALLVASLLMVALAPVVTKRFSENINVGSSGDASKGTLKYSCVAYDSGIASFPITFDDVYDINFVLASGGGGGGGSRTVWEESRTLEAQATGGAYQPKYIDITEYMDDFKIEYMTGGGGGGGGGAMAKTEMKPSKDYCANYNKGNFAGAVYDSANKFCVTKFNHTKATGTGTCWTGYKHTRGQRCKDQSDDSTDPPFFDKDDTQDYAYSACGRAVCNYKGAVSACADLARATGDNWRLPTAGELSNWGTQTSREELALCGKSPNFIGKFTFCAASDGILTGENGYAGWPYAIWSSTPTRVAAQHINYQYERDGQKWLEVANGDVRPLSTRCVYDGAGNSDVFYSVSGGGGGGAPAINASNGISAELNQRIKENVGGRIRLMAGPGGYGGVGAPGVGQASGNSRIGDWSCVEIEKPFGNTLYKFCTSGGRGAAGAGGAGETGIPGNAGGDIDINNGCFVGNEARFFPCSSPGSGGTDGTSSLTSPATGGIGGASPLPGSGGIGGGYSNESGITLPDGSSPGAGGGAGRGMDTGDGNYLIGNGARGSGGYIKVSYKLKFPVGAGGGGAGGAAAKIENIYIGPKAKCMFTVGKGGKGGALNNSGEYGGNTSVQCISTNDGTDSRIFEVTGGRGGIVGGIWSNGLIWTAVGGKGGDIAGDANSSIYAINPKSRVVKKGFVGKDGNASIGGSGGASGTGVKGGCGAGYSENGVCNVNNADPNRINGGNFTYKNIVTPTYEGLGLGSFGTAGAGGGGGGWVRNLNENNGGIGGDGMAGYACWYWYDNKKE